MADALGVAAIDLPLTPAKLAAHLHRRRSASQREPGASQGARPKGRALHGSGEAQARRLRPERSGRMLLDPKTLAAIIPGCHDVEKLSDTHFRAEVTLGVGPVTGRYKADIAAVRPRRRRDAVTLTGIVVGALGDGRGAGRITLAATEDGGTRSRLRLRRRDRRQGRGDRRPPARRRGQDRDPPILRGARAATPVAALKRGLACALALFGRRA